MKYCGWGRGTHEIVEEFRGGRGVVLSVVLFDMQEVVGGRELLLQTRAPQDVLHRHVVAHTHRHRLKHTPPIRCFFLSRTLKILSY